MIKKLLPVLFCLFALTACGRGLEAADIEGSWENAAAVVTFGGDGTYEIKYADFGPGELSSENGEFELSGGEVELRLRDRYVLDDAGEIDFTRLTATENRRLEISLEGDTLTLDGEEYARRETD